MIEFNKIFRESLLKYLKSQNLNFQIEPGRFPSKTETTDSAGRVPHVYENLSCQFKLETIIDFFGLN